MVMSCKLVSEQSSPEGVHGTYGEFCGDCTQDAEQDGKGGGTGGPGRKLLTSEAIILVPWLVIKTSMLERSMSPQSSA